MPSGHEEEMPLRPAWEGDALLQGVQLRDQMQADARLWQTCLQSQGTKHTRRFIQARLMYPVCFQCCGDQCPPCEKICGKQLSCNKHKCQSVCHNGPCYPCKLESQVNCRCGKTRRSVPCGREKNARIVCQELCRLVAKLFTKKYNMI